MLKKFGTILMAVTTIFMLASCGGSKMISSELAVENIDTDGRYEMKIEYETLNQIIFGAVDVWEEDGAVRMCRFSKDQVQQFIDTKDYINRPLKAPASSNMYMEFYTDSEFLGLSADCFVASGKPGCWFDVYVDDVMVDNFGYPEREDKSVNYSIKLKSGEKKISIYFPGLYETRITSFELDDGASITPVTKERKLLFLGDSITQGYITEHPSLAYTDVVTRGLNAEAVNQGIGGDIFRKENLDENLSFKPDTVFVAYGTNDWKLGFKMDEHVTEYLDKLTGIYPDAQIYVILPIWRTNHQGVNGNSGLTFDELHEELRAIAEGYDNVKVIDGMELVEHHPKYFCDDGVHPNTEGFKMYGEELLKRVK